MASTGFFPVLITTIDTHVVMVAGTCPADAVAQIVDSDGADLDQLLDHHTRVQGDFTARIPSGPLDQQLVAEHATRTRRPLGPTAVAA